MGDDDCKTGSAGFRWLCVARSVVALVITAVAALVVVRGLHLVLRPGEIELNISYSNVFVEQYSCYEGTDYDRPTPCYSFKFYMEASNPSEIVFLYFRNITVQLLEPAGPDHKLLAEFDLSPPSLSLSQKDEQEYLVSGHELQEDVSEVVGDKLFDKTNKPPEDIKGAIMVLSGILTVENTKQGSTAPSYHTSGKDLKFNCAPVDVKRGPVPQPSSENYKTDCIQS